MTLALKHKPELREEDLRALISDVRALRRDMATAIRRARPGLREAWDEAVDGATDAAERLSGRASTLYRDAARQSAKTYRVLNKQFRDQPAVSVAIAFGLGVLLSRLMGSSRD